jgi:uncharacterized protein
MKMMRIPTQKECLAMFETYEMLPNIREHSVMVGKVTEEITSSLLNSCPINAELAIAGALLHDITKTQSFKTKERHAESGALLLTQLGYPEVADIVLQHVNLKDFSPIAPINEIEIVYYADKRVRHHEFVSVEDRIHDLLNRYGHTEELRQRFLHMKEIVLAIELKIEKCINASVETVFKNL